MDVISKLLIIVVSLACTVSVTAMEIDSCLAEATRKTHVIDQQQAIETCFLSRASSIPQKKCFEAASRIGSSKRQLNMSETLNSICFYQTQEFSDLKSCLGGAKLFKIADNHDEAIFDCYKQFQSFISEKQCVEVSRKMIYPAKRNHLFAHCQNNF